MVTPQRLYEHQEALVAFHNAYQEYLEATLGDSPADPDQRYRRRAEVNRLLPKAQAALNAAGVSPELYPPMMTGGVILRGLANVVFVHEGPGYRLMEPSTAQHVLDLTRLAHSQLEERERLLRRQRRNPLYWGDRLLRAVLGFPAYVLSLILGVPLARIEQSPWGTLLRVAELIAGGLGLYFGGQAAGWWD